MEKVRRVSSFFLKGTKEVVAKGRKGPWKVQRRTHGAFAGGGSPGGLGRDSTGELRELGKESREGAENDGRSPRRRSKER